MNGDETESQKIALNQEWMATLMAEAAGRYVAITAMYYFPNGNPTTEEIIKVAAAGLENLAKDPKWQKVYDEILKIWELEKHVTEND